MINFRFHLISLVAVFLALAVGVAMGASFVDRATVETLQARVDDLGTGFRERGDQLSAVSEQLGASDAQAAALAGEGSAALAGRLADRPVVLITSDGVPGEVLDATRTSLAAAGAVPAGTLRLQSTLALTDDDVARSARERFGLRGRPAAEVRQRVLGDLGAALSILSAEEPPAGPAPVGPDGTPVPPAPTTTSTTSSAGTVAGRPTDAAGARAVLDALVELGLVAVDTGGAPAGATFPGVDGVQYVLVVGPPPADDAAEVVVPLAEAVARAVPAVITVAEARPSRPDGAPATTVEGEAARGEVLADLRDGDVAERLSTVDDLEESFGRIALVLAVAEHAAGRVGHYGTGAGAQAPFPTVPAG